MSNEFATDTDASAERTLRDVGTRIRQARSRTGKPLHALAGEIGISASMLSMLERGAARPSIGTLVAVAAALGVPMAELFEQQDRSYGSPVHRAADQTVVETSFGVLRRLALTDKSMGVEMVVNEYQPGTESARTPMRHDGVEFGLVTKGSLAIEINGLAHLLKTGDAVTYSSREPHRISNPGRSIARAVWLNLS